MKEQALRWPLREVKEEQEYRTKRHVSSRTEKITIRELPIFTAY